MRMGLPTKEMSLPYRAPCVSPSSSTLSFFVAFVQFRPSPSPWIGSQSATAPAKEWLPYSWVKESWWQAQTSWGTGRHTVPPGSASLPRSDTLVQRFRFFQMVPRILIYTLLPYVRVFVGTESDPILSQHRWYPWEEGWEARVSLFAFPFPIDSPGYVPTQSLAHLYMVMNIGEFWEDRGVTRYHWGWGWNG